MHILPTLSTFPPPLSALITLLLTRQGARRSDRLSIAEAELVIAIALFCCFPDLPFIPPGPSESYFCSHPGRRRVTTAAAVRSFVFGGLMGRCAEWPDSPCGSSGGSGRVGGGTNTTWSATTPIVCAQSLPAHHLAEACPGGGWEGDVKSDVRGSFNHISPPVFAEGLKEYFCKFGEVKECMVMRDPVTKRSR